MPKPENNIRPSSGAKSLAREITDRLIGCHRSYGWRAERESLFSRRRIDVLAIAQSAHEVIGFEIKISRQDFKNELRDPDKREAVMRHCTQFYFVVPENLIHAREIPDGCGLVYYRDGWMWVEKSAPGKKSELTFEIELRDAREDQERRHREWLEAEEREQFEYDKLYACGTLDDYAPADLPGWMFPRFIKPLRFQFDVMAVAEKMASVLVPCAINFDEVLF